MGRKMAITFLAAIVLGTMAIMPSLAEEAQHEYVGNSKCKMCHKGENKGMIWERWLETPHALSMETLDPEKGEDVNPGCLKCHVTGFGQPTGYSVEAPNEDLASVGCEACHGPGNDYKKISVMKDKEQAVAAGLIIPTEETCTRCHNEESPTFKGFNYKEALVTGTHTGEAAKVEKGEEGEEGEEAEPGEK
jgi:hypothetical protein